MELEVLRQSINNWERREGRVHHAARQDYHSLMAQLHGGGDQLWTDNGGKDLMWAAMHGHINIAKELIRAAALDVQDDNGNTALDVQDDNGNTALMLAVGYGHTDVALELIRAGADLDVQNIDHNTALIMATEIGHTDVALELIRAGADLDVQGEHHRTALLCAAERRNLDIVKALIKAKANLNAQDKYHRTPLMCAVRECFLDYYSSESMHLHPVATIYQGEIVKALIKAGADIDIQDREGKTARFYAEENGYTDIVRELAGEIPLKRKHQRKAIPGIKLKFGEDEDDEDDEDDIDTDEDTEAYTEAYTDDDY